MYKRILFLGLGALLATLAVACGDTSAADPTPVQTWKITPASGPPPTQAPPTATSEPSTDVPGVIDLIGVASEFDREEISAPAGSVTINFDNQDAGVVHNVHFFAGTTASGESVGETDLEVGPVEQTLTMELTPGEYFYQCDAHPTTMKGVLTVS
jgi:plastocyanin